MCQSGMVVTQKKNIYALYYLGVSRCECGKQFTFTLIFHS